MSGDPVAFNNTSAVDICSCVYLIIYQALHSPTFRPHAQYKKIVSKRTGKGRTCDIIHIVKLDDNHESAFLIQDMFPISEKYIEREYTIAGNHLRLTSEHAAKEIEQKARKVLEMLKRGIKFTPTQPDIQKIYERLQQDLPATHL